tara:strand:+ start:298 stop:486 length:189 start_codon:yes stop_codon:yes gene_type:complete
MEVIWGLLLTICTGSTCLSQDIEQFDTRTSCEDMLLEHALIPHDGDWDSVEYICKPIGSLGA